MLNRDDFRPLPYIDEPGSQTLTVDGQFDYDNHTYHIPTLYFCEQGLIFDIITKADVQTMRDYIARDPVPPGTWPEVELPIRMQESPWGRMEVAAVWQDGRRLGQLSSCGQCYIPGLPEYEEVFQDFKQFCQAYPQLLQEEDCFAVHRMYVTTDKRPQPGGLSLRLHSVEQILPLRHYFEVATPAGRYEYTFQHPQNGRPYHFWLAAQGWQDWRELQQAQGVPAAVMMRRRDLPNYFVELHYGVEPALPAGQELYVIEKQQCSEHSCGIICGADGPGMMPATAAPPYQVLYSMLQEEKLPLLKLCLVGIKTELYPAREISFTL